MRLKIFKNIFILSFISIVITATLVAAFNYFRFLDVIKASLKNEAEYIKLLDNEYPLPKNNNPNLSRITVIAVDGSVIYDSKIDAGKMENHLNRPEIQEAFAGGSGEDMRESTTFGKSTYYYALKKADGSVIRVASETMNFSGIIYSELPMILIITAAVFLTSIIIARKQSRKIIEPINKLDLENPLYCDVYDELSPVLLRIKKQQDEIKKQKNKLQRQKDEFTTVTENMSEGLIILGGDGKILSSNSSALRIFRLNDIEGMHYLEVNRNSDLKDVVESALSGEKSDNIIMLYERYYSVVANPIYSANNLKGATLLIFDCTEKQQSEKLRREFTANVSHELKTPLTSISGYAEIIKAGIAKNEDIPEFCEKIRKEASRMLYLIDDILRLSKLDENVDQIVKTEVSVSEICREVCERLKSKADKFNITINQNYDEGKTVSSPQILEEIIYNLCDNAIKYGKPGGHLNIFSKNNEGHTIINIEDDGIGINEKYHSRVFERFFRVDKSHSKQIGGTGLGLAIVKHSAEVIGARIEFESIENQGTKFKVIV